MPIDEINRKKPRAKMLHDERTVEERKRETRPVGREPLDIVVDIFRTTVSR